MVKAGVIEMIDGSDRISGKWRDDSKRVVFYTFIQGENPCIPLFIRNAFLFLLLYSRP